MDKKQCNCDRLHSIGFVNAECYWCWNRTRDAEREVMRKFMESEESQQPVKEGLNGYIT